MKIEKINEVLYIEGINDFNLDHIFDCGQCFRWEKNAEGSYTGIAHGRIVTADYNDKSRTLSLAGADEKDFEDIWRNYFDLNRDYSAIKKELARKDNIIKSAIEFGHGIRILNQEKWETLISFIISQNNNIPRIKKCINSLAATLGEQAGAINGTTYYSLPSPERLASATLDDLAPCRLGYRAKYLIETARAVADEGVEALERLGNSEVSSAEALQELRRYCGVGPKVANCISLFSLGKFDSFPIDVWVKKVMNRLYGIDEGDMKAMTSFAAETFGEYGGIAQQYLFYYITHNKDLRIT